MPLKQTVLSWSYLQYTGNYNKGITTKGSWIVDAILKLEQLKNACIPLKKKNGLKSEGKESGVTTETNFNRKIRKNFVHQNLSYFTDSECLKDELES